MDILFTLNEKLKGAHTIFEMLRLHNEFNSNESVQKFKKYFDGNNDDLANYLATLITDFIFSQIGLNGDLGSYTNIISNNSTDTNLSHFDNSSNRYNNNDNQLALMLTDEQYQSLYSELLNNVTIWFSSLFAMINAEELTNDDIKRLCEFLEPLLNRILDKEEIMQVGFKSYFNGVCFERVKGLVTEAIRYVTLLRILREVITTQVLNKDLMHDTVNFALEGIKGIVDNIESDKQSRSSKKRKLGTNLGSSSPSKKTKN
jgi:hypothetical protein